ncbi:MAG TPA: response regulator [Bdellovibrionales bacterium]|nr:response regulator [Bdellovibrionales bacterium]
MQTDLRKLSLYFLTAFVALFVNSVVLYRNLDQLADHKEWVLHTYEVLDDLKDLETTARNLESIARGYMIAAEPAFFLEFDGAKEGMWKQLEKVQLLTADNSGQQHNIEVLKAALNDRLERLNTNMDVVRKQGPKALVGSTLILAGKESMDRIARQIDMMASIESGLLAKRTEAVNLGARLVLLTFFTLAGVALGLVILAYWLVRAQMKAQILESRRQRQQNWVQSGLASLGQLFSAQPGPEKIAERTLHFLIEKLELVAGNFFVLENNRLDRVATVAGSVGVRELSFVPGEGLVGAAAQRADIHQIAEVPEGYFPIDSSLGSAPPRSLLLIPLKFQDATQGVIELAGFDALDPEKMELVAAAQEQVAVALATSRARERQDELLEETQRQSEELQTQQEELRTSNEELEEQSTALLRSQERLESQQEELRQINEELEAQARSLEKQQDLVNSRNEELERSNQYKSEFLAKMSHELRTPLNSMLILSSLLDENKERNLTEQQREFARTIHDAGSDLLTLINDILDLSKLEARKLHARPETFAVQSLTAQIDVQFRALFDRRGVGFSVEIGKGVPETLYSDRQRLEQILRNFLSNAAKFTEKGGVKLIVTAEGDRVRFAVKDSGIGIPDYKVQAIFEAFEQVDGSISRKYGGTGLGLTISRELAALLQGRVQVESQEGKGSTFALEIPAVMTKDAVSPAPAPEAAPVEAPPVDIKKIETIIAGVKKDSDGRTLLIVEDDEKFRKAVEEAARTHGFNPISAADGETALELLKRHVPEAILLDIKLPGVSGMSVLEHIKKSPDLRHIPIHMISAMEHQIAAMRLGAMGYLGKPVSMEDIKGAFRKIERVLDKRVKQLLVIEDDERQMKAIQELLRGPGVEIATAHSGEQALDLIRATQFECIIVDLSLPDLSGIDLLERIHAVLGENVPPIIVYTGRDLKRQEEERLREFSESIIIKGAKSPERLLDEVNLFLHRVESDLPNEKRSMLAELRLREESFEGRSVLLVDDDLRNVFALTSALESKGLKVFAARNGLEALDALEKNPVVDAVLMDIMMPKMDGYEAIRRIRKMPRFERLPIIALTAKAMKQDLELCLEAGANDYLPKPVNLMSLISILKVWLAGKRIWN